MKDRHTRFQFIPFMINLLIPLIFSALSSLSRTQLSSLWYISLSKPERYPTFSASGFTRSIITFIIGTAAFMIWRRRKTIKNYSLVIGLYFSQLLLNLIWSYVFFDQHWITFSAIIAAILILLALTNMIIFFRISKVAGIMLGLYFVWCTIIAYLSIGIYHLN